MPALWNYQHVSDYLAFARAAFKATAGGKRVRLDWAGDALDADGFRAAFVKALHNRINLKAGRNYVPGRKWSAEYQIGLIRDRDRLRQIAARIRVYQFETPQIRARFGDRLARYDD